MLVRLSPIQTLRVTSALLLTLTGWSARPYMLPTPDPPPRNFSARWRACNTRSRYLDACACGGASLFRPAGCLILRQEPQGQRMHGARHFLGARPVNHTLARPAGLLPVRRGHPPAAEILPAPRPSPRLPRLQVGFVLHTHM